MTPFENSDKHSKRLTANTIENTSNEVNEEVLHKGSQYTEQQQSTHENYTEKLNSETELHNKTLKPHSFSSQLMPSEKFSPDRHENTDNTYTKTEETLSNSSDMIEKQEIFPQWQGGVDQHIQFLENALREVVLHIEDKDKDTSEKMCLLQDKFKELEKEKKKFNSRLQKDGLGDKKFEELENLHIHRNVGLSSNGADYTNLADNINSVKLNTSRIKPLTLEEEITQQIDKSFAQKDLKQKDIDELKDTFYESRRKRKNRYPTQINGTPAADRLNVSDKGKQNHNFISNFDHIYAPQNTLKLSKKVEERIDSLNQELKKISEKQNQDHLVNAIERKFSELEKNIQPQQNRAREIEDLRNQISNLNAGIEQLKEKILFDNFTEGDGNFQQSANVRNTDITQQIDALKSELTESEQRNNQLLDMMQKTIERVVDKLNENPKPVDASQEFFSSPKQAPQGFTQPSPAISPAAAPSYANQARVANQTVAPSMNQQAPNNNNNSAIAWGRGGIPDRGSIRTQIAAEVEQPKTNSKISSILGMIKSRFTKNSTKTLAIFCVFAFSSYSFYSYVKNDLIDSNIIVSNYADNNLDNIVTSSINMRSSDTEAPTYSKNLKSTNILPTSDSAATTLVPHGVSGGGSFLERKKPKKTRRIFEETPKEAIAIDKNFSSSMQELTLRAENGDLNAQYALAENFLTNVEDDYNHRYKVLHYFAKAAEAGLPPAQYRLALIYEKGDIVETDIEKALQLYEKAAKQGNVYAMHNLGVLLTQQTEHREVDFLKASYWFQKAAEFGFKDSQYNLAILYEKGLGVKRDIVQAYVWYAIAASKADAEAASKRDIIARQLSSEGLNKAGRLIGEYTPKEPLDYANKIEIVTRKPPSVLKNKTVSKDTRQTVKDIQMLLFSLGYNVGIIDGIKGDKTVRAIRLFQKENGDIVDGRITAKLLKDLVLASSQ